MVERTRNRLELGAGFKVPNNGSTPEVRNYETSKEVTIDVIAKGDNHNFTNTKTHRSGGLINGKSPGSITGASYVDFPSTYQRINSSFMDHLPLQSEEDEWYATKALRRTMPERPSVQALVSLLETREIPGLLREAHGIATRKMFNYIPRKAFRRLKKAAKLNLMIQFGVLPILSDLEKLSQFQSLVDSRVDELNRIKSKNGLRRTVVMDRLSAIDSSVLHTVHSSDGLHHCRFNRHTSEIVKAHVRWIPSGKLFQKTDQQLRRAATAAVIGAYLDPSTLYEAMPWSWLIDYFVNLGDFVALTRNELDVTPSNPRITSFRRTETLSFDHDTLDTPVSITRFRNTKETIRRRMVPAGLSARSSFLTERQTSILGSLAILRG